MKKLCFLIVMLTTVPAFAQEPVEDPTVLEFTSTDHDNLVSYETDIVSNVTMETINSIITPKGQAVPTGEPNRYYININVQPINFGIYHVRMRSVAPEGVKSLNSADSNNFERAPGAPSKPIVK